jgi:hypothetical protein
MTGKSRRDFLRLGGAAALAPAFGTGRGTACIVVWQGGGASHLDTFDMKPDAPREIRGEFKPIRTAVPGLLVCEHLPLTARIAHKLTIVRSMHSGDTNHERAARALLSGIPPAHVETGGAGLYAACAAARRAVERGARFAIAGAGGRSYDTHTNHFNRLRHTVLPEFDRAFSALVTDLDARGLLATTLVVAMGEFGRTPRINDQGGRDHHARAWSVVMAGAGLPGGRVVGATDRTGTEVVDAPVTPADLLRTIHAIVGGAAPETVVTRGRVVPQLLA